jgi:integral membrane protein (TIGR00529 family)
MYWVYLPLMEIAKLAIVFVFILILLRFKLGVGPAIFLGGILLGFLFGEKIAALGESIFKGMVAWRTIRLILIVSTISTLGALLKNLKITGRLVSGVQNISGSTKTTLILCPVIIGLMPMPGGALLSAPLVGEASEGHKISPAHLSAINYWFRHIFEFCWPIYPGIILSAAILKVEVSEISLWQAPFSIAFILGGLIFLILPMKNVSKFTRNQSLRESWINVLAGVWPILAVVFITFVFDVDLIIGLAIAFALFLVVKRPAMHIFLQSIKEGCSFAIISLMFGIMVFQSIINDSGAAVAIAHQIASWGVPDWAVVAASCFIIGFVAGIVTAYVGIVYPILIAILLNPAPDHAMIVLAYASGLIGVMVSPLHLCLILTKEYFKSSFAKIYPLVLGPAAFVTVSVVIALILGYGR